MLHLSQVSKTFPSVRIASECGGLPVEVSLIAQLGHGSGDHLLYSITKRQKEHHQFIDELDEPSAKLGNLDFEKGDPSSLYSFTVGAKGHPWHRHAGNRIFTAISGSGGCQLRFSTASQNQIDLSPVNFIHAMHFVNIPADCLFTVRFGGDTWHQFCSISKKSHHPVLFALSCHPDELGGNLSTVDREKVLANDASIPSLTELLPADVEGLLKTSAFDEKKIPLTTLSLDAAAGTLHRLACDITRHTIGLARGQWSSHVSSSGFISNAGLLSDVEEIPNLPDASFLRKQQRDTPAGHRDFFRIYVKNIKTKNIGASKFLSLVLDGFLVNAPNGVGRLMALRNILVKPLGLRTSPLGCPVSSLLSEKKNNLFLGKHPVIDQLVHADDTQAEVILGADDKHLSFRSCVGVKLLDGDIAEISLGNLVYYKNWFGRIYMNSIETVHRHYVSPTMLRMAADYAITHMP